MAKTRRRSFTDLSFTRQDLSSNSQKVVAKTGYHILLRVKPRTAINAVWSLKVLAKGQGIKSVKKIVGFKTKSMLKTVKRKAKTVKRKAKRATRTAKTRYKRARTARTRPGKRYKSVVPGRRVGRKYKKYTITKRKKGVHYTRSGQPYKILANGQTRFVKR